MKGCIGGILLLGQADAQSDRFPVPHSSEGQIHACYWAPLNGVLPPGR
jgi:hypothetical protein